MPFVGWVAVIVALPAFKADIVPYAETVATVELLDVNVHSVLDTDTPAESLT